MLPWLYFGPQHWCIIPQSLGSVQYCKFGCRNQRYGFGMFRSTKRQLLIIWLWRTDKKQLDKTPSSQVAFLTRAHYAAQNACLSCFNTLLLVSWILTVYYHPIAVAPFSQIETWGNNRISGERLTDDVWVPQLAFYSRRPQLFRHLWTHLHVNTCQMWQVIVIYILNLQSLIATSNSLGFWWNRGAR